jgi:hypothetical protein
MVKKTDKTETDAVTEDAVKATEEATETPAETKTENIEPKTVSAPAPQIDPETQTVKATVKCGTLKTKQGTYQRGDTIEVTRGFLKHLGDAAETII